MTLITAYIVFVVCFALIVAGSAWLSNNLHVLGGRYAILPGLLGLITALGADAPEISSGVTALFAGERDVGVGVVLGSNLFNLAALLGLSACVAGTVSFERRILLFHGAISVIVTALAAVLLYRLIAPMTAMILIGLVFILYVAALSLRRSFLKKIPAPRRVVTVIGEALEAVHVHATNARTEREHTRSESRSRGPALAVAIALSTTMIIAGGFGIVHTALAIGTAWGLPKTVLGMVILAALTGLPNAYTAVSLARRGEGTAVISETMNSNTINIVVGVALPTLFFGVSKSTAATAAIWWLIGLTLISIGLAAVRHRLSRRSGAAIIGVYLAFVALTVYQQ